MNIYIAKVLQNSSFFAKARNVSQEYATSLKLHYLTTPLSEATFFFFLPGTFLFVEKFPERFLCNEKNKFSLVQAIYFYNL